MNLETCDGILKEISRIGMETWTSSEHLAKHLTVSQAEIILSIAYINNRNFTILMQQDYGNSEKKILLRTAPEKIELFLSQGGFQGLAAKELQKQRKEDRRNSIATANNIMQIVFAVISIIAIIISIKSASELSDLKKKVSEQQKLIDSQTKQIQSQLPH